MSNGLGSLILVVLLIGLAVLARRLDRDASRVIMWHNVVWAGALILFGSNLIAYDESSPMAWLVLGSGLVAFNAGSFISVVSARKRPRPVAELRLTPPQPLLSRSFLLAACVIYFVAFALYLYYIDLNYGIDALLSKPESLRAISPDGQTYLSRTPLVVRLGLYLGPVLFMAFAVPEAVSVPLRPAVRILMIIAIVISMFAMLQRTNLFVAVLWYFAYAITKQRSLKLEPDMAALPDSRRDLLTAKKRRRRLVVTVVVAATVLLGSFQLVGSALGKTGQQALSTGRVSSALSTTGMSDLYVYATAGVPAFLHLVDSQNYAWPPAATPGKMTVGDYNPQTYGAAFLDSFGKLIPGAKEWNSIAPFMDVGILTNVFTWFELPYRDFRLAGVVVFGFLIGFAMTYLFVRRFKNPRTMWIQSALFSTMFLCTFVNRSNTLIFWIGIAFVVAATSAPEITRVREKIVSRRAVRS